MNGLLLDCRQAARGLRRSPGAAAVAALALALGIGVNASSFIWVSSLVLHPFPYPRLERIMTVWETVPAHAAARDPVSPANFLDWKAQSGPFQRLAAYRPWDATWTGSGEPERLEACLVTADFFPLLGMRPALGRDFTPSEETPGDGEPVVVSHGFWQRRLASDPAAVGRSIRLDDRDYTLIGVMPEDFDYPLATDVWAPLQLAPPERAQRGIRNLLVLGLLKPHATLDAARASMNILAGRLARAYPDANRSRAVSIVPLRESTNQITGRFVLLLAGSAGFVFLLACANVASLMLARATARQRQSALESALGAGRMRVVRLVFVESAILAGLGGALGLWLAWWNLYFTRSQAPPEVMRFIAGLRHMRITGGVALGALGLSLAAALLCGLPAVLMALRRNASDHLADGLKQGGRSPGDGPSRSRLRGALVSVEIALALVLLVGAALMTETFRGLLTARPGYNAKHLLTMNVDMPGQSYGAPAGSGYVTGEDFIALPDADSLPSSAAPSFFRRALAALRGIPGVRNAAAYAILPAAQSFTIEGRPAPGPADLRPGVRAVTAGYFETLELPVQQGRGIAAQDAMDSPPMAVLSESVARRYWPDYPHGQSPLGARIRLGDAAPWLTVAGVCGDVKNWFSSLPETLVYVPNEQNPRRAMTLLLRTSGDPVVAAPAARAALRAMDGNPPVYEVKSMEQVLAWQSSGVAGAALSMEIYAFIALLLAVTGVYALTAYAAARRTHEIGIRMALGARAGDVVGMVVGQSLRVSGAGLAVGLPAALLLGKLASTVLLNVIPMDLVTIAAFTALLAFAALIAACIPARRAAALDPMSALHEE
ncbi:MAG TPA: ABC transporter permease [Bryobacteraceae bacterium]|nr:ABC transporter permease [Bryobacteraceae bacterium]